MAIFGVVFWTVVVLTLLMPYCTLADRHEQYQSVIGPPTLTTDWSAREHVFTLRHIFRKGSHIYPNLSRRLNISSVVAHEYLTDDNVSSPIPAFLTVKSYTTTIQRLSNRCRGAIDQLLDRGPMPRPFHSWTTDDILAPDITNKTTVLNFARMAADAYVISPGAGELEDIGEGFNHTNDFGWENDGLRGHVFADTDNMTVVISFKGTTFAVFDGPDTSVQDKLNDNLFGSCCCGQGGHYTWKPFCQCQTSAYTCNSTCLTKTLRERSKYYHAARDIYHNVTALYPNANIWLTGHSLGGVVTALLGLTYGLPALTYEAFPDALSASRLNLPVPPGYRVGGPGKRQYTGHFHFGHTADPVYMGTCNSFGSSCTISGYALQSQCHTGYNCTYDTVGDLGWRVSIGTHRISSVIEDVIEKYDRVPEFRQDANCNDCHAWKFFESNETHEHTSTSSMQTSSSRTRSTTCRTPGWWGCLDESTTISTEAVSTPFVQHV